MTSGATLSAPESEYARKTRARILAAAEKRFRHYGFGKTTIVEITSDCAMSHANVHRFFRNKTERVDAIAAGWLAKSERVCRDVADRPQPAAGKRREYLRDTRTHELLSLASFNGRPFVTSHLGVLAGILVE